jgi:hypothetical protein
MKCTFHVGQKVTLVNDRSEDPSARRFYETHGVVYPVVGVVYTVRKVAPHTISGVLLLLLEEINNRDASTILGFDLEPGFEAYRFRPVVTRSTDISIFQSMLNPSRVEEHA